MADARRWTFDAEGLTVSLGFAPNGQLTFDPPNARELERAYAALAGDRLESGVLAQLIYAWEQTICNGQTPFGDHLPPFLRQTVIECQQAHRLREADKTKTDPLDRYPMTGHDWNRSPRELLRPDVYRYHYGTHTRDRVGERVKSLSAVVVAKTRYRVPQKDAGGSLAISAVPYSPAFGTGRIRPPFVQYHIHAHRVERKPGEKPSYRRGVQVTLTVPHRWYFAVYKRGHAVIDGLFVFTKEGNRVLAGRQGETLQIIPQWGTVERGKIVWDKPMPLPFSFPKKARENFITPEGAYHWLTIEDSDDTTDTFAPYAEREGFVPIQYPKTRPHFARLAMREGRIECV